MDVLPITHPKASNQRRAQLRTLRKKKNHRARNVNNATPSLYGVLSAVSSHVLLSTSGFTGVNRSSCSVYNEKLRSSCTTCSNNAITTTHDYSLWSTSISARGPVLHLLYDNFFSCKGCKCIVPIAIFQVNLVSQLPQILIICQLRNRIFYNFGAAFFTGKMPFLSFNQQC